MIFFRICKILISDRAARGSGSANSGGSARFSRQRKRKGKRRHEKWRQRKRKGKRYHEKRRQRKRKGKRRNYRCPEGSDNYRCPSPHLYFLLSYFVTFLLTSLHSSDLVLHGVSEPCPYLEPWVFLAIWRTFPTNVAVDILFSLSLFSNFERTLVFADELLQWGKKWHKWVRFISTQLLNELS